MTDDVTAGVRRHPVLADVITAFWREPDTTIATRRAEIATASG